MKVQSAIDTTVLFLEFGQDSLKILCGDTGLELPLERLENGRLAGACQERLITDLQEFLKQSGQNSRLRALCAVGARGVSFRRVMVPQSTREDLDRVLGLQIEREFPLPPEQLAWGYRKLDPGEQPMDLPVGHQAFLVVAVRKEIVEEYAGLLARSGISAVFTLSALARSCLWPQSSEACAALDIGRRQSELISFEQGVPVSARTIPWGGENITEAIQEKLGIGRDEAEKLKLRCDREHSSSDDVRPLIDQATSSAVESLARLVNTTRLSSRLVYVSGRSTRQMGIVTRLAKGLGCDVESIGTGVGAGPGLSTAIEGLKRSSQPNGRGSLLILHLKDAKVGMNLAKPALRKLVTMTCVLLGACLLLPYAEALILKPSLSNKLAEVEASRGRLASIDREFDFLRFLKKNQPPYLEAIYLLANAAPQGTRFDSLTMNRRGEVSFRGNMKDSQQVLQFRSKLIDSGFFSSVVVEEQTPTPDRQKLVVRMTAQWKPTVDREKLKIGPTPDEIEKIKAAAKELGPGGVQMMPGVFPMAPGAFPPGRDMQVPPQGARSVVSPQAGTNSPSSQRPPVPTVIQERKP